MPTEPGRLVSLTAVLKMSFKKKYIEVVCGLVERCAQWFKLGLEYFFTWLKLPSG